MEKQHQTQLAYARDSSANKLLPKKDVYITVVIRLLF